MESFFAKNLVGRKFESVSDNDESDSDNYEDPEEAETQRKEEKKRKDKHRQMEGEREKVRKGIRDKYGLKKRDSSRLEKTKKVHRSTFSSSDDKHHLHKNSPSLQRTESPSRPPACQPPHAHPSNSQSKMDVFTAKISSCVVQ